MIWSAPATKLAVDFGISDVAVAKRCIKLGVPRPSPGYWAKLAAGRSPAKKPLPPTPEEVFAQAAGRRVRKVLALPGNETPLLPLAAELMRAIRKAGLDSQNRASVREPTVPEVKVSKPLAERVARAFHVILAGVEPLGICFRKTQSTYSGGFFKKGHDRLYLRIEEGAVGPDGKERQPPIWQWHDKCVPSGHLSFTLQTDRYTARDVGRWSESNKLPLEKVLSQIVTTIRHHYLEIQERRAQEAIERARQRVEYERRCRERQAEEAIRLQRDQARRHTQALTTAAKTRKDDLLKAAEWWRLTRTVAEFINECELKWKNMSGELAAEQHAWLSWAREHAQTLSPFAVGYPNPAEDGGFDPSAVVFGGPYPTTRNFVRPPTMPITPLPATDAAG